MKPFVDPEIEITRFTIEDIVTTSAGQIPSLELDDYIGWDSAE